MDVRAILLVGSDPAESIAGIPIALLEVLGRPVLQRVAERLRGCGITSITAAGDGGAQAARVALRAMRSPVEWVQTPGQPPWRAAQRVFSQYVQAGAELVLLVRLGAFTEIDFEHLIQFHLDRHARVTAVINGGGELLGTFVISASRRNDAAFMLRHRLQAFRTPFTPYPFAGYCNPLATTADLRQLAVDAFEGKTHIVPEGEQIKPGVWVAAGARLHRSARVLAPAFIGERVKLRASTLITRCSVLERHVHVDCGTVVENATVLPYTTLGAGLDVSHAVVGFRRLVHLRRQVEVEIGDPKLIGALTAAPLRALTQAASLANFFPLQFVHGLFGRGPQPADLPAAVQAPSPALRSPVAVQASEAAQNKEFPALVVARRYGND
ncbi:MAG: hypothetical protein ACE14M_08880 [Terriglobales bacterium]